MIPPSVTRYLERTAALHAGYRAGQVHVRTPEGLKETNHPIDDLIATYLPVSHEALERARNALFFSLPVAFDPAEAIGPYLATADRDERGEPFRFLDMGALIATQSLGENDPEMIQAVLAELPVAVNRYAHSEYQTTVSLRMKAALDSIAPDGAPRHFVVNTGAEAVENAIKAVLLNRVRGTGEKDGGYIISFEGAYHGRTLGSLAVTHRKRARFGFPTFDWPQVPWPSLDDNDRLTRTREDRSLRRIWRLLTLGRHQPRAHRVPDEPFAEELGRIDGFLDRGGSLEAFAAEERARIPAETLRRALRCAGVLAEPIQGEGGIRMASGRFFRRLRVLTRIYEVPLLFDEIQTGFGATGRMWAHQHFELPAPPDVVTWAKKAQNGVLFVSEELATFFQEEKKFNTTWEGDAVGMVRLLVAIRRLRLEDVERTGALVRAGLEGLVRDYPELLGNVRGLGVMLGFDVARADWRDVLRDRAFRRGLLLMGAGERSLRVYPRYDTEPYAIEEAMSLFRAAVQDLLVGDTLAALGPRVRMGAPCDVPMATIEAIDLAAGPLGALRPAIMSVEMARYGGVAQYPAGVLKAGARPLLQYPVEALEGTMQNPRAIGVALRDSVSGKVIAYALGSPLENYDEEGVSLDPSHGEGSTFYLQAMATLPSVRNQREVEHRLLDHLRQRAAAQGFGHLSTLIEEDTRAAGPPWLAAAQVIKVVENYLGSGVRFVYVHAAVAVGPERSLAMRELSMWFDGAEVGAEGGQTMPVENPATEEVVASVPRASSADVERAVAAARRAQPAWRRVPGAEKARLLHEIARVIRERGPHLAELMTIEGGKPMIENLDEIEWTSACFDYYAEIGRSSRGTSIPPGFEHQVNFTVKEPFGVVGVIVPFNYPLLLMSWKVAPALAAGNTVVIKPADRTPMATLALAEAFALLPRGVVGIVTGTGPEAGEALVTSRGTDMIAFTGSTTVGKRIMRLAADTLKKVNLETSGIDPFIVCEDADVDVAARGAAWARYLNSGQVCTSAKRFYVVDAIADRFVARFVEEARRIVVGDPRRPETDMGPVISADALGRARAAIDRAVGEGAELVAGGDRPAGLARGHFLSPTVLDRVTHGSSSTREEVFGPVAAIVRVADVDEAIRMANDSDYGLGANIYTNNLRYVMTAMEEIKAGTFWVNDPLTDNEAGPFGGMRQSGIGRELGEEGLDAFREPKHVHIDYVMEAKSYWFPYAQRKW